MTAKVLGSRRRVATWLATRVVRQLRERADRENRYLADVFWDAFARHREEVSRNYRREKVGDLRLRPRRRRRVLDPTQCFFYFSSEEIGLINDLAEELEISRSELVSAVLEMELTSDER